MNTRPVRVIGVGQTEFGVSDEAVHQLGAHAVVDALHKAPVTADDIDSAYVGNVITPAQKPNTVVGQLCLYEAGLVELPVTNVENACSSSSSAFRFAHRAVESGREDVALVLGVEKMTGGSADDDALGGGINVTMEQARGYTNAAGYAMRTNAYEAAHGVDDVRAALTHTAIKNHANATENPYAHFRKAISEEDVLESPLVADPLRVFDMCPISDGGAAAIIAAEEYIEKHGIQSAQPIEIVASTHSTGDYFEEEIYGFDAAARAATNATRQAGVAPAEIDLFELNDATTASEIFLSEAIGLCEPGDGVEFILDGHTERDGTAPVNPSGGLKARGHPLGATGVAQINELVWQLRGDAGGRQVSDARIGMAENAGGSINGVNVNQVVHILEAV